MEATLPLTLDVAALEQVVVRPSADFTEEDFVQFCREHSVFQIERNAAGEVMIMAPAGLESDFIVIEIVMQLRGWAKQDRQGVVLGPTAAMTLPDRSVMATDASWIPMGRWKALPRKQRQGFGAIVPAFVVEVRTPNDRRRELQERMHLYLRNRVELAWLIDPQAKMVTIYSSEQATPRELIEPERVFGEGPVAGFVLELKQIYDQL